MPRPRRATSSPLPVGSNRTSTARSTENRSASPRTSGRTTRKIPTPNAVFAADVTAYGTLRVGSFRSKDLLDHRPAATAATSVGRRLHHRAGGGSGGEPERLVG